MSPPANYEFKLSNVPPGADPYEYQSGFGNTFSSEAVPGALPIGQNNPQKGPYGLIPEQITGTAFIAPRHEQQHSYFYRIKPSICHDGPMVRMPDHPYLISDFTSGNPDVSIVPEQASWAPFELPTEPTDFVAGIKTIMGSGQARTRDGQAVHIYTANTDMKNTAFVNNDGDFCIMVEKGRLDIQTEFGFLMVHPCELVVIQRGMRFKVRLPDGPSRGYIQELYTGHYRLPDLGPLGGSGLAQRRDFLFPVAAFEEDNSDWEIIYKICGAMFKSTQDHSPFEVVAWHGNYAPYKYDIAKFRHITSAKVDHIDPSNFVCLTADSFQPGHPLLDVLVINARWDVASQTFRPPYFHRNCASEFVGSLHGRFGGKEDAIEAGGATYDSGFTPHGIEVGVYNGASAAPLTPMIAMENITVFMFETAHTMIMTKYGAGSVEKRQTDGSWKEIEYNWPEHREAAQKAIKSAASLKKVAVASGVLISTVPRPQ